MYCQWVMGVREELDAYYIMAKSTLDLIDSNVSKCLEVQRNVDLESTKPLAAPECKDWAVIVCIILGVLAVLATFTGLICCLNHCCRKKRLRYGQSEREAPVQIYTDLYEMDE